MCGEYEPTIACPAVMACMLHMRLTSHIGHKLVSLESMAVSALLVHARYVLASAESQRNRARGLVIGNAGGGAYALRLAYHIPGCMGTKF